LKVEADWLKKNSGFNTLKTREKAKLIEPSNKNIPIARQCELLEIIKKFVK
jgi:hypothetical protein